MILLPDDRRYIEPAVDVEEDELCPDECEKHGHCCTLLREHKGDHAAHTPDGRQVCRWDQIQ